MKKIDTIVVAPHFYTMEGAGVGYYGDAAMAVDGGKILEVGDESRILAEYTAEAVSYTHLDVYKRQFLFLMMQLFLPGSPPPKTGPISFRHPQRFNCLSRR